MIGLLDRLELVLVNSFGFIVHNKGYKLVVSTGIYHYYIHTTKELIVIERVGNSDRLINFKNINSLIDYLQSN